MKTQLSLFLLAFLFISCIEEEQQPRAYYHFYKNDENYIIKTQHVGQEFLYKNQHGESKLVELIAIHDAKHQLYSISSVFLTTNNYFYFDSYQHVYKFKDGETQFLFKLNWKRWPIDYAHAIHDVYTPIPSLFDYDIPFFRYLNPEVSHENSNLVVDITQTPISMEVDGVVYNRVVVVHRNTPLIGAEYQPALYMDLTYGIIGFDDKDGNLWRLVHLKD